MANPNASPVPTPVDHQPSSWAERAAGVAIAGVAGYGIHKGFQAAPVHEALGSPVAEVAEVVFMGSALALTGLRESVADVRIRRAERTMAKAGKRELMSQRHHASAEKHYDQIMEGLPRPYTADPNGEYPDTANPRLNMVEPDLLNKIDHVRENWHQKLRHPFTKLPPDTHRATVTRREQRDIMKMNVRRDKRRLHDMEAEWMDERFAKGSVEYPEIGERTSDLGTDLGWQRFYSAPRTRAEVRGYKAAINTKHHAEHAAHHILQRAEEATITHHERAAEVHATAKKRQGRKLEKLQAKKEAIANREDLVSRVYDTGKEKVVAAGNATGRGVKRVALATGRGMRAGGHVADDNFGHPIQGVKAAPAAFREGRDGTASTKPIQRGIDRVAARSGKVLGKAKAKLAERRARKDAGEPDTESDET